MLKHVSIDTMIGLPANLFYSTGVPVCSLVLKKCGRPDDVLFINVAEHFEKGNCLHASRAWARCSWS